MGRKIREKANLLGLKVREIEGTDALVIYETDGKFTLLSKSIGSDMKCNCVVQMKDKVICLVDVTDMNKFEEFKCNQVVYNIVEGKLVKTEEYTDTRDMLVNNIVIHGDVLKSIGNPGPGYTIQTVRNI